jgi:hypothetical protein
MHGSRLLASVTLATLLVGACSPSVSPSPSVPSTPTATAVASPTPNPPTVAPSPSPAPLSEGEQRVADAIRVDARVGCGPIRTGLPEGADAAVECHPDDPIVDRVEVVGFGLGGDQAMFNAYLARLAGYEVQLGDGDCAADHAGDSSWPANLPDEGELGGMWRELRSGCFIDNSGIANVVLTCYGGILVGITGTGDDLAALYEYGWRLAQGESPDRDPPGMCAAPD